MNGVPFKTRIFSAGLAFVTVGAVAASFLLHAHTWTLHDTLTAVILFAMIVVVDHYQISFPQAVVNIEASVNAVLHLAAGLILGPLYGVLVVMSAELLSDLVARRQFLKIVVNVANFGLATLGAATVYNMLTPAGTTPLHSFRNMAVTVLAGLTYSLINSWCLALVVSPVVGMSATAMWKTNFRGFYVEFLTLPTVGAVLLAVAKESPLGLLLVAIPLAGPYVALQGLRRNQEQTRATVERLADALERRDPYTHQHSIRVAGYVRSILAQMPQVPFETAQAIAAAARIHDLGKVGTRDIALNKPSALTDAERREMQLHAAIGAEIIGELDVYKLSAAIVRHHHERWDGSGYPDGLRGEAIPLGSRIIGVADAFDAMTSDRVYRRAMSVPMALAELRRGSGTQFDPQIVAAFERALTDRPAHAHDARLVTASAE